jgi:hypothetical protein
MALLARVDQQQALLFQNLLNSELIGIRLINMRWSVATFKGGRHSLLTSDRPFVMTNGYRTSDLASCDSYQPNAVLYRCRDRRRGKKIESHSGNGLHASNERQEYPSDRRRLVWLRLLAEHATLRLALRSTDAG